MTVSDHQQTGANGATGAGSSGPAHAIYRNTRHFSSLNGLRFLCIFAVLWHHAPVWAQMADAPQLLRRGFLGVDFFFVLSGFLITTLLLREEDQNGRFSLRGFYWRRFLRIVPVYFLVVTLIAVFFIGVKGRTGYLELLPFYYLFLSNFLASDIPMLAPTWSLSVEEQYYLVWPLLLLLTPRRFILPVLAGLIVLNVVAVTGGLRVIGIRPIKIDPLVIRMFTATYAPILIGSGLAVILHNKAGFDALARVFGSRFAAPVAFLLLPVLIHFLPADLTGWPNLVLHFYMAACLTSIVIREDHLLRPFFVFRPVARVGEISYGIYLYHLIALHITVSYLSAGIRLDGWLIFVTYSLVAILISELSFRYYETPFLNLRHKKSRSQSVP
ncbi:acyltransferase family protein [Roseobacter ponti]|uniref:Acyltransferase n=1 Tax=Roseobacter ponti TaxID=1891787 RepID=A0A858STY6_9RHOB|nr:acyltransferase [Roseobacter ponti]QJF50346.1 acyltransferase [Roseobacter ponti]